MITLQEFFNTDFVNYSSYDNLRKIAQIDGLKNAQRKIVYTLLEKNIKDPIKVSQLGAKICEFSDYLHGNLDNVIVTLGQDYPGTNNVPLVQKKGNFGTRFNPDPSASRYIYACGSENLFKLFKKEDKNILINQTFEGYKIEPKFYLPTLPVLLINGADGISSGFAQKILPRNPKKIKEYLIKKLSGKNPRYDETPFFKGFNGVIEKGDDNQWLIKGTIERKKNKVLITEIPVGFSLKGYIQVLDKLEDSKVFNSYKDLSDNEIFKFEVTFPTKTIDTLSDDEILDKLKLIKRVTENFTILDENNKIKIFKNSKEILDYYLEFKLKYMQKRKEYLLKEYSLDLSIIRSKLIFIKGVIDGSIVVAKKTKAQIIRQIEPLNLVKVQDSYDYLLKMPLYSLTAEKLKELSAEYKKLKETLTQLKAKTIETLYSDDLLEL